MKKILHIYKTYYPFSRGGVETTIDLLHKKKSKKYKIFFVGCGKKELKKKIYIFLKQILSFFKSIFSKIYIVCFKEPKEVSFDSFSFTWPTAEILSIFLNKK